MTPTPKPSQYQVFLPMLVRPGTPDLIGVISLSPAKTTFSAGEPVQIRVTITNRGTAPSQAAWADLYINPARIPVAPNTPWNNVCSLRPCFGLAWRVPALEPGASVILTSAKGSYAVGYTNWQGWFANGTTDLYVYVDSWNSLSPTGAVAESDETNNRAELRGLRVVGRNP
jgi:hypothetical protein